MAERKTKGHRRTRASSANLTTFANNILTDLKLTNKLNFVINSSLSKQKIVEGEDRKATSASIRKSLRDSNMNWKSFTYFLLTVLSPLKMKLTIELTWRSEDKENPKKTIHIMEIDNSEEEK